MAEWYDGSTRTVKAGTQTWFVSGEPPVAGFIQATPVEVQGPDDSGWFITTAPVPRFPSSKKVFLREEHFEV